MQHKNFETNAEINNDLPRATTLKSFQTRSEAVQEIISRKPGFVEKWALLIFLGMLLAVFAGIWFIRYPDTIQTRAILSDSRKVNIRFYDSLHNKFYAITYLPQKYLGKVDTGMQVQLRLDAYPFEEFGFLKGKISCIADSISERGCLTVIELNGLFTNYNKLIIYKSGLEADVLIITKEMRLMQRFSFSFTKKLNFTK